MKNPFNSYKSILFKLPCLKYRHLFLLVFLFCLQYSYAQPGNDNFASAITLAHTPSWCSADAAYTTSNATADGVKGSAWTNGPNYNVWFKFQATTTQVNAQVNIGGTSGNMRHPFLALWNNSGTEITSSIYYSSTSNINVQSNNLIIGNWYYISVDNYVGTGYQGTFSLCIDDKVDYDYKEEAITVPHSPNWCSADAAYTTLNATPDGVKGSAWTNGPNYNRWFKFQATTTQVNAQVNIGGTSGSMRHTFLALWDNSGTEISSSIYYSSTSNINVQSTGLIVGNWYYISVDNYVGTGYRGSFSLCVDDKVDYDYKEEAITVPHTPNWCSADTAYSTLNATPDGIKGSVWTNGPNYNRWFKFQATTTQVNAQVNIGGTSGSMRHPFAALWDNSGTEISSSIYYSSTSNINVQSANLIVGDWYYISVDNYVGTGYRGTFSLCVDDKVDYDFYEGAIDVSPIINSCSADAIYDIRGGSPDRNAGSNWNNSGPKQNRWFKFQAPATGEINITVDVGGAQGSNRTNQLALWQADGVTEISSKRYIGTNDDVIVGALGLTPGSWYYISVDAYSGYYGTFSLCLQDQVDYDFYEGAIDVTPIINSCSADAIYDTRGGSPDKSAGSNWNNSGPKYNRWFKFQAPATGEINITVDVGGTQGSNRTNQLALWQADGVTEINSRRYVGTNDDVILGALGLTPGSWYYISVDAYSGYYGTFSLCLQDQVDYDFYEGAIDVTSIINSCSADAIYDTSGASPDKNVGSNWNNSGPKYNRWFKFQATASGEINITVDVGGPQGNNRRTQIALWQADGVTEINSKRYIGTYDDVVLGSVGLTPGSWYYISVDAYSGYDGTFSLCLQDQVDYDFYEGAIDVTPIINSCSADAIYDTRGASPDKNVGSNWNNSGPKYNRWFKFTASGAIVNITVDIGGPQGSQRRTQIALWQADGITEINSARYVGTYDDLSLLTSGLTPGNTYYISVDAYAGYYGTFSLCLEEIFDGDSDFDGLTDSIDKDDDNDGILDTHECTDLTNLSNCEDTDNDSIPDYLDLDSDNDGIPDIVEAGLGSISAGFAIIPSASFIDSNNNGMHDPFESNIPLDSDGDGTPNYRDLDSDNDTVFDVDEARTERIIMGKLTFENGDGDLNGDGVGDGLETEAFREKDDDKDGVLEYFGDGILDIYDYGMGANEYGNLSQGSAPYYVKDTDNDGTPDYIDTTSDGSTFDIAGTHYTSLDANNDGIIDDTVDSDGDGIVNLFDTNDSAIGSPRDLQKKLDLFFDGRNDYVEDINVMSGWSEATLMAWIKIDPLASGDQVIFGQNSFFIQLNADKTISAIANGNTVSNGTAINTNQWTHVLATYSNTNSLLVLYINGQEISDTAVSGALPSDSSSLTLGRLPDTNSNYFNGYIDEARVFSKALATNELQKMVYQEIEENGGKTTGAIIPVDITNMIDKTTSVPLDWNNLKRYFRMDAFKDNVLDDLTTPSIDVGSGARMYNTKLIADQTAPLPFVTNQIGRLEVAVNDPVRGINGNDILNNASAIVKIQHNDVYIDSNIQQVGLIIDEQDSGSNPIEFKVLNDSELNVSWYLKLDGKIDLEGESQLVQGSESYLDPTGSGTLEKDQQGTADTYTYNYWSMPVGVSNNTTNNNSYTLPDVFTNVSFLSSGYNGTLSPIGVADYWIWKYSNLPNNSYASWQHVRSTGTLLAGEGFTMKGPGTGSLVTPQNYVLEGKPNNGDINLPINAGNEYLVGNPYPSAIDAHQFILDNGAIINGTGTTTGTLYFWEHWGGGSHNLSDYQGGYATYSLAGGIPAASKGSNHPDVGTGGVPTKVPGRYIPVGQGFFVNAESNGMVNFNNGQRVFQVEDGTNSVFTKSANTKNNKSASNNLENLDKRTKLRIGFYSVNTIRRQLLITVDSTTTSGYDWGYDAPYLDNQLDDMYWMIENKKYSIQGINKLDNFTTIPLGIHTTKDGVNSFSLDNLENDTENLDVYLHDKAFEIYHDLKDSNYEVELYAGEYLNRFEIAFSQSQSLETKDVFETLIETYYSNEKSSIIIQNPKAYLIKSIEMFNILGQSIFKINADTTKKHLEYSVSKIESSAYVIKITNEKDTVSKKVLVE